MDSDRPSEDNMPVCSNQIEMKEPEEKNLLNKDSSEDNTKTDSEKNTEINLEKEIEINSEKIKKLYPGLYDERLDNKRYRENPKLKSENNKKLKDNLKFYTGKIQSQPDGDFIDNILNDWKGDYELLETHHGYIQWLFPNREAGINFHSQTLQLHELETLKKDHNSINKLIKSFELMLDFFGMELKDGKIFRSNNYESRYSNLKRNRHNFLRICRILKCLGDFDLEDYQIEWIRFLIKEIFVEKKLKSLDKSMTDFYVHTIKDDEKRIKIIQEIELAINTNVI